MRPYFVLGIVIGAILVVIMLVPVVVAGALHLLFGVAEFIGTAGKKHLTTPTLDAVHAVARYAERWKK